MTPPNPKVSVSIVTYNQAKYIAQALDSALMQETNFDYEILIGEDDSSDGTREIVKTYAQKRPDKIRLFLNDRKNVIYIDGKATGRWNLLNNLKQTRGEYVALLEGDDYWTSPHKLQTQVDFLESHPGFSFCYHLVRSINESGEVLSPQYGLQGDKDTYAFEDLLDGNFIPTCSVLFRSGIEKNLPEWFTEIPIADWAIHLLNAKRGSFGCIQEVMGVYRRHSGGIWGGTTHLMRAESDIKTFAIIGAQLDLMKSRQYRNSVAERYYRLSVQYQKQQQIAKAKAAAHQSLRHSSGDKRKKVIKHLVDLYFPALFRLWRNRSHL